MIKTPARWTFKSCGDFFAVCFVPGVSSSKDQMSESMIGAALGGRRPPRWKVKGLVGRTPPAVENKLAARKNEICVVEEVSTVLSMESTSLLRAGFMALMAGEYLWRRFSRSQRLKLH